MLGSYAHLGVPRSSWGARVARQTQALARHARTALCSRDDLPQRGDGFSARTVGVGIYFGVKAKLTYDDAVDRCTNVPDACAPDGVRGGRDAHRQAAVSTTAFALGGVLLAAGTAGYFMVPDSDVRVESALEDGGVRLGLGATW
jgi:hypothetical protein